MLFIKYLKTSSDISKKHLHNKLLIPQLSINNIQTSIISSEC